MSSGGDTRRSSCYKKNVDRHADGPGRLSERLVEASFGTLDNLKTTFSDQAGEAGQFQPTREKNIAFMAVSFVPRHPGVDELIVFADAISVAR